MLVCYWILRMVKGIVVERRERHRKEVELANSMKSGQGT